MADSIFKAGPLRKHPNQTVSIRTGATILDVVSDDNTSQPVLICRGDLAQTNSPRRFLMLRSGSAIPAGAVFIGAVSFGGDNAVIFEAPV